MAGAAPLGNDRRRPLRARRLRLALAGRRTSRSAGRSSPPRSPSSRSAACSTWSSGGSSRGRACSRSTTSRRARRTSSTDAATGSGARSTASSLLIAIFITIVFLVQWIFGGDVTWWGTANSIATGFWDGLGNTSTWAQFIILPIFFIFNFLILMGPMMMMGISQIKGFEPGDANWGVKLEDVRGQAEAKEEVRRIVSLWTVGRGVRAGGRTPRARHPLPRRAGHRQDDAGEGDRDRLQLAVRHDPGLGVRPDLHRRRRADRPLPGAEGEAARGQVGRPVHRLHRRDRRRGHAPLVARRVDDRLDHRPLRRPLLLRAERLAHPVRRPDPRDPRLARADVRAARLAAGSPYPAWYTKLAGIVNQGASRGCSAAARASWRSTSCW